MTNLVPDDFPHLQRAESFISKLHFSISKGFPHAEPVSRYRIEEHELVKGVLQMLQGLSASLFYWDEDKEAFCIKDGIYASHLSQTSLNCFMNQFLFSGTCLKKVDLYMKKVASARASSPTLSAFVSSISSWLKTLRYIALREEEKSASSYTGNTTTLLGLTSSLSSLCVRAEYLLHIVDEAIPDSYFQTPIPSCEIAVNVLDHLFRKLNEVWLIENDEEEAYHMLLSIFIESLLPYLEGLDSWLYDGTLDDPFEELFFYANSGVSIDEPSFWETSYFLRQWRERKGRTSDGLTPRTENETYMHVHKEKDDHETTRARKPHDMNNVVCPAFMKGIAKSIISAGKSLQLVQHVEDSYKFCIFCGSKILESIDSDCSPSDNGSSVVSRYDVSSSHRFKGQNGQFDYADEESVSHIYQRKHALIMGVLTLPEVFLVSLVALLGDNDHIYENFKMRSSEFAGICESCISKSKKGDVHGGDEYSMRCSEKTWLEFISDTVLERRYTNLKNGGCSGSSTEEVIGKDKKTNNENGQNMESGSLLGDTIYSFCPQNPILTVCQKLLAKNIDSWDEINIKSNFHLPPMNDDMLHQAVFCHKYSNAEACVDTADQGNFPRLTGTDYTFGFQFDEAEHLRLENDTRALQALFVCPTLLPSLQDQTSVSVLLPSQRNSTLASRILEWVQNTKMRDALQPAVIIQECLSVYIKKQVDQIGEYILLKLMSDWKLMDELGILRAIYLLGSGDLLQQFLIVIFNKLDKGEVWEDDFELNAIMQESIRNSAEGALLGAPDSLVVSLSKSDASQNVDTETGNVLTPRKLRSQSFGIDALDMLKFSYKVCWPLDLIANAEALKKYNQVMCFLLKVKRAKFVLDKARKWMWKARGSSTHNYKHHLLVEQKLLHFVDAFHQYVMDRVLHSAWTELCTGMSSARSLDEVIEVHEAYLLCIQRQCFVAPDKLWALIASRIKTILSLALDFYCIQQTLHSGGAAAAIKARCEMEVDRIEKQFDDCIAFLLRILSFKLNVGHFPHLADLVTRINYNYFYMTDSGDLLTIPRFQATAKLEKVSAFRSE